MFVKPDEFSGILENQGFSSADAFGIAIDDKFYFNLHIDRISKSVSNQLNVLMRLKKVLGSWGKALIDSFVLSKFSYCLFSLEVKSFTKIEAIPERVLRFMKTDMKVHMNIDRIKLQSQI